MEYKPKTIYCPKCGRKVGTWDGRTSTPQIRRCKKCRKRIVYHPNNGCVEVKNIPERKCSSGITFM